MAKAKLSEQTCRECRGPATELVIDFVVSERGKLIHSVAFYCDAHTRESAEYPIAEMDEFRRLCGGSD